MLAISFFDLYPESVEAVGSGWASCWFFIGVAFFAVIVAFIPNPDSSDMMLNDMVLKDPVEDQPDPHAHESASRQHEDSIASQNGSAELRRRRKWVCSMRNHRPCPTPLHGGKAHVASMPACFPGTPHCPPHTPAPHMHVSLPQVRTRQPQRRHP